MEPINLYRSDNVGATRSAASDALTQEILQHQDEDRNRSYLSKLVVGLTQCFHGEDKSLEHLDALRQSVMLANITGDSHTALAVQQQIGDAVSQDKSARKSADTWSNNTSGFVKSVGLFFPGSAGYAMAAMANAADSAHPQDSLLRQSIDGVLGASKGAVMKLGFDKVGQSEMNIALKAGTLSIANRFAEVGLNSHTYFDSKTGEFDALGGLRKTGQAVTDLRQLGTDMVTFGGGYLLLNKLGVNPAFAKANPMLAQTLTGAGFGFSNGFFSDLQTQQKLGDGFDMTSALKNGFIQMGLDGAAAAIGGYRIQQMQSTAASAALEAQTPKETVASTRPAGLDMSKVVGVYGLDRRPVAIHHNAVSGAEPGLAEQRNGTAGSVTVSALTERFAGQSGEAALGVPEANLSNLTKVGTTGGDVEQISMAQIAAKPDTGRVSDLSPGTGLTESAKDVPESRRAEAGIARSPDNSNSTGIREFVTRENVSGLLSSFRQQGLSAQALLSVREVLPGSTEKSPALGPEKTMLIQHAEPGMNASSLESLNSTDWLATCSPEVLKSLGVNDIGQRHVFPDAGASQIMLQVPGSNRLRFSLPDVLKNSEFSTEPALALGNKSDAPYDLHRIENPYDPYYEGPHTVSGLLRGVAINDRISNIHSVDGRLGIDEIADAMKDVQIPVERIRSGGGDSIVFDMSSGGILKVTDLNWKPDWGKRTLELNGQQLRFDGRIEGPVKIIPYDDHVLSYYVQQKGHTPVSVQAAVMFDDLIRRDGRYEFWDKPEDGVHQLAYVPLERIKSTGMLTSIPVADPKTGRFSRGLALIDYNAVRVPGADGNEPFDPSSPYGRYDFTPGNSRK